MMDFFVNYGLFILELCIGFASLVLLIFRKNKAVVEIKDTPFERVLRFLPSLIQRAEQLFRVGSEKKSFVLSVAYALLVDYTGEDLEVVAQKYSDRISAAIESILETPQKKEA